MREFASFLARRSKEIGERSSMAKRSVQELSVFWSDAKFREFNEIFKAVSDDLDVFLEVTEKYRKYLNEKVMLGEKFLRR
jgi:hypothetical protein